MNCGALPPKRRVVLLGASNLTRGISTVVETAHNLLGEPLEVLAALGHGRSYGMHSMVLGRTLPGIVDCGLWEAISDGRGVLTAALVTDIGNDILYNVEVPQIVQWVQTALDRLHRAGASVCMTSLPLENVQQLSPARFGFFRRLLFPRCRLTLDEVVRCASELQRQLEELAQGRGIHLTNQCPDWYGFDPIHIRLPHWRHAWRNILLPWQGDVTRPPSLARGSLSRWIYLRSRRPLKRWWLGVEQRVTQPSGKLRCGTTVSFY